MVICIELLHHFEDAVLEKTLGGIREIIKPGGIFVFDVKNKMNPVMWYKYKRENSIDFTLKARTIFEIKRLVERYGFQVFKKKSLLFPNSMLAPYVILFSRYEER